MPRTFVILLASFGLAQAPIFRTAVEVVRVDVLVTKDGRPVSGLRPADFEVLDAGVTQVLDDVTVEQDPVKVVMALDSSSSLGIGRAQVLREACEGVLDALRFEDHAGLLHFGDHIVVRSGLTRDLALVRSSMQYSLPPGQTALVDAVQASLLLADSEPGRGLVLLLTDGIDVSSYLTESTVLETAARSEAVVYGISFRSGMKPRFLERIADATGGALIRVESAAGLERAFKGVLDEFRQRYLLSYVPRGVPNAGWHELKVRVRKGGVVVKARPGYYRW